MRHRLIRQSGNSDIEPSVPANFLSVPCILVRLNRQFAHSDMISETLRVFIYYIYTGYYDISCFEIFEWKIRKILCDKWQNRRVWTIWTYIILKRLIAGIATTRHASSSFGCKLLCTDLDVWKELVIPYNRRKCRIRRTNFQKNVVIGGLRLIRTSPNTTYFYRSLAMSY